MRRPEVTESPVRRIRAELRITQVDLANACGVASRTVASCEEGASRGVPGKILETLEALGYDRNVIEEEHAGFLATRQAHVLETLKTRRPDKDKPTGDE